MMAEAVANQEAPVTPPTAGTETPPAVAQDPKVSQRLQVLVQREKQALAREQVAKQKEAELEAKIQAFKSREDRVSEFESRTKDPMKAIEHLGYSYQDLTAAALNDGTLPPEIQVRKVEEKFDAYIKAQEAAEKQKAEDAKKEAAKSEEKVIHDFKSEINAFIDSDPLAYELIKFDGLQDYVFLTIDEHYSRTMKPETGVGEVMSIKDAADKVEKMLEKKYEDAKKLTKFNQQPKPILPAHVAKPQDFTARPKPQRTLTNQLSATPAPPRTRPLTDDERVQKAIAYARGLRP